MKTEIVPFEYEGKPVSVPQVDGEPWFVAADVCAVLDLENPTKAIMTLDADERALTSIQGNRGWRHDTRRPPARRTHDTVLRDTYKISRAHVRRPLPYISCYFINILRQNKGLHETGE